MPGVTAKDVAKARSGWSSLLSGFKQIAGMFLEDEINREYRNAILVASQELTRFSGELTQDPDYTSYVQKFDQFGQETYKQLVEEIKVPKAREAFDQWWTQQYGKAQAEIQGLARQQQIRYSTADLLKRV